MTTIKNDIAAFAERMEKQFQEVQSDPEMYQLDGGNGNQLWRALEMFSRSSRPFFGAPVVAEDVWDAAAGVAIWAMMAAETALVEDAQRLAKYPPRIEA